MSLRLLFVLIVNVSFNNACNGVYYDDQAMPPTPLDLCLNTFYKYKMGILDWKKGVKITCDSNGDAVIQWFEHVDCSGNSSDQFYNVSSNYTVRCDSDQCDYGVVKEYWNTSTCDATPADGILDTAIILNECFEDSPSFYYQSSLFICEQQRILEIHFETNDCTVNDASSVSISLYFEPYCDNISNNGTTIAKTGKYVSYCSSSQCWPTNIKECWNVEIIKCWKDKYSVYDERYKYPYIQLIFNYIFIPFTLICIITVLIAIYLFIKNYCTKSNQKNNRHKPKPQLFYIGLTFLIITLFAMCGLIIWRILLFHGACLTVSESDFSSFDGFFKYGAIYLGIYFLQGLLLSVILFMRVYYIFKPTQFALPKTTVIIYCILFCLYPFYSPTIPGIWIMIVNTNNYDKDENEIRAIWLILGYICMLLFSISFTILFVKKLLSALSQSQTETVSLDNKILKIVTKTIILQIISSITQFVVPIFVAIPYASGNYLAYQVYEADIGILLDIYTNFVCIIMSYAIFNNLYLKLCGFVDRKCRLCWFKCTTFKKKEKYKSESLIERSVEIVPINQTSTV